MLVVPWVENSLLVKIVSLKDGSNGIDSMMMTD